MTDLPYDYEDFGMTEKELRDKYADTGGHPEYTPATWSTIPTVYGQSYWEWVMARIAEDDAVY